MNRTSAGFFKPAWWCSSSHGQTIVGALFRPSAPVDLKRKRLETPDGDFLDIDFLEGNPTNGALEQPTVVILHGLEGSSNALYVQSLLGEIKKRGFAAAAVNMRMCSGESNRLIETYHSGRTDDLGSVIRYLREEKKRRRLFLVGFSVGGNIVLKWLGEQGERASQVIEKAAAISVPYDLVKSVELLDRGFNRVVYTRSLLASLKRKVAAKKRLYPDRISYDEIKKCRTFRIFDRVVTARLNGFRDEMDYWTQSSCQPFLKEIRVQTLLIHAEDDPFFPGRFLPLEVFQNSDYLHLLVVPSGGHLGFVMGEWPWKWDPWLEERILDFLAPVPAESPRAATQEKIDTRKKTIDIRGAIV